MRGKLKSLEGISSNRRITPAHAGKTCTSIRKIQGKTDHPRTCGENAYWLHSDRSLCGSPPHMRGKRRFCGAPASIQRITPAHAGKTKALIAFSTTPTDHPRTCGENLLSCKKTTPSDGSPPHMRGKRLASGHTALAVRITPAHAGKTCTL